MDIIKNKNFITNFNKNRILKLVWRDKYLLLMFIPFLTYYVIFNYVPMAGLVIAFKDFKPGQGLYYGEWVGFKWILQFFNSFYFLRLVRNTVLISTYSLLFGFPVPIIFAICITEIHNMRLRRVVQTASYLPYFISTVVMVGILYTFFSSDFGIINQFVTMTGRKPINFLNDPAWFRRLFVGSGIWQGFGFSSIIYIAAITGIDPTFYEAAKMDGITKFKEVIYITIPMISSTIIVLFIMALGGLMSVGFEKAFLLQNSATMETGDVINTYVYRKGIMENSVSFASAVGLFNSIINFTLVFIVNKICRALTQTSLW